MTHLSNILLTELLQEHEYEKKNDLIIQTRNEIPCHLIIFSLKITDTHVQCCFQRN